MPCLENDLKGTGKDSKSSFQCLERKENVIFVSQRPLVTDGIKDYMIHDLKKQQRSQSCLQNRKYRLTFYYLCSKQEPFGFYLCCAGFAYLDISVHLEVRLLSRSYPFFATALWIIQSAECESLLQWKQTGGSSENTAEH